MRCPNCNDVKKKSDQDDVLCDYCYEASYSDGIVVFEHPSESIGIQFLQKTACEIDGGTPTGTIILWDANRNAAIPDGFERVGVPNFAGQNSDFDTRNSSFPFANFKNSSIF